MAAPGTDLGEALRVQRQSIALTHQVRLFLYDVEQPLPRQIGCDAIGLVENDANLV